MSAIEPVCEGLWSVHHREFSVGGLQIGTRSNVIRLGDGSLALHAPGPLDAEALAAIRALGTVSLLLVPNRMHTLFTARVAAAFPEARVLASPGVAAACPGLTVHDTLGDTVPEPLRGVAELRELAGCPKLDERVLFLPATRTLLGVDLAFNLHGMSGLTRFAMWINQANERFCVTRLARAQFVQDAAAAQASVRAMAQAWDIERIVVSHGQVLASGGREALVQAWTF